MEQLERKVSICQQLMAVADIVEPGLTRIRGSFLSTPEFYLKQIH